MDNGQAGQAEQAPTCDKTRKHVELQIPPPHGRGAARIVVGGVDVSHVVRAVHVSYDVSGPDACTPIVDLELSTRAVTLNVDGAHVGISDDDRAALVALGWTPPEQ